MDQQLIQNLTVELKRGTLIIVVLQALKKDQYGYSLLQDLDKSGVEIEAGTLYPLLRRLESQGLLESTWDTTESRPRKYYKLNEQGITVLDELIRVWYQIVTDMDAVIKEG
jgi:PadR family transcriptional regulator, regulatory protein PadR